jgi:hypothetical protein
VVAGHPSFTAALSVTSDPAIPLVVAPRTPGPTPLGFVAGLPEPGELLVGDPQTKGAVVVERAAE